MRAERIEQVADFLAATGGLQAAHPLLTNTLASVAISVTRGRRYDDEAWWVVRDDDGLVAGAAIRTAPFPLIVSPMSAAAARALGDAVGAVDTDLPGATGPADVVDVVLEHAAPGRRRTVRMDDVVYVLDQLRPPVGVPGAARPAAPDDIDLLVRWHRQFASDAGVPVYDAIGAVTSRLDALWLWHLDGQPVAMAGHAPPVDSPAGAVGRIGPVYTPEPLRRRGFGASVTSHVATELRALCRTVMLYADAANTTSNGVYRRLGFREQARVVEVALG